jgi:hypothetical protein
VSSGVAPQRFLDPKILSRISSLELLARSVVEGFLGGLHRSPRFGASTDFAEHRQYMPGDDIRRVDWKVYARSDKLHLKQYQQEIKRERPEYAEHQTSLDDFRRAALAAGSVPAGGS